ncbi:MAG: hypothetical protein V3W34_17765, partial [Phycisphaerae bacterium]
MTYSTRQPFPAVAVGFAVLALSALPCKAQQCVTNLDCDDGVGCTTDLCDPANPLADPITGCVNAANDANCDNLLFCDGAETCDALLDCQAGTSPCTNPLLPVCDEAADVCVECLVAGDCDDGLFCNGAETCDTLTDTCQAGTPPVIDDGVACTDDSCDEVLDVVVNTPNDANCDNLLFCDGVET